MKLLIVIVLITVMAVRGRFPDVRYSSDDVEMKPRPVVEYSPQEDPSVSELEQDASEGDELDHELLRIPRQDSSALLGPWMMGPPRTLSGAFQENVRLGMGSPLAPPLVPLPLAQTHNLPVHPPPVQSMPYIAGYSVTPILSQKPIPLMNPPLPPIPCPYNHHHHHPAHTPYTFPLPVLPPAPILPPTSVLPSTPGMFFNRQISIGMGRSAKYDLDEPEFYHPVSNDPYSNYHSSEPYMHMHPSHYNHHMMGHSYHHPYMSDSSFSMEPSNIVAKTLALEPPSAPAEELLQDVKDSDILTNVIP